MNLEYFFLKSVDSTQKYAKENYNTISNKDVYIIIAEDMSNGQTRSSDVWLSYENNIMCTMVIKRPLWQNNIALLVAYVITQSFKELFNIEVLIKWPNDVYSNKGNKICGILVDIEGDVCYIGFGINTHNPKQKTELKQNTISSIYHDYKVIVNNNEIIDVIVNKIVKEFSLFKINLQNINDMFLWFNSKVSILQEDVKISGVFAGIDQNGAAIIGNDFGSAIIIQKGTMRQLMDT